MFQSFGAKFKSRCKWNNDYAALGNIHINMASQRRIIQVIAVTLFVGSCLFLTQLLYATVKSTEYDNSFLIFEKYGDDYNAKLTTEDSSATTPKPQRVISKYHEYFSIVSSEICPNYGSDALFLVLVHSQADDFSQRMAIRYTWKHYSTRKDTAIGFFTGRSTYWKTKLMVQNESLLYSDVIVSANEDGADNATLRTMSALEWVSTYCYNIKYVVMTNDTMFLNVLNIRSYLLEQDPLSLSIFGKVNDGSDLEKLSGRYPLLGSLDPWKTYPEFLSGELYVLTMTAVNRLYPAALNESFFIYHDIFLTGFAADRFGISRIHINNLIDMNNSDLSTCRVRRIFGVNYVSYFDQFKWWGRFLNPRIKCP